MTLPQRQKVLTIDKQELHYQKKQNKTKKTSQLENSTGLCFAVIIPHCNYRGISTLVHLTNGVQVRILWWPIRQ